MSTLPWDATASFSWYLYQADVALLVTLEKIKEIWIDNIDELKKWSLEVEWEEDFTLIKSEEWKAVEKHLYQVKEYEKTTKNNWDILNWTDILKFLDWVIKLFQCTLENNNSKIDCKTYICWKRKIVNSENKKQNKKKIFQALIKSEDSDIWYIKYKILFPFSEKKKWEIKDIYSNKKGIINKYFEIKIKINNEKFKNNFSIWRKKWFWEFDLNHKKIINIIFWIKSSKDSSFDKNQSDNYLRYFESKIKRMIQWNKNITKRKKLNLYDDILKKILDFDRISFNAEDYQDMFLNLFIEKFKNEFDKFYYNQANYFHSNISTEIYPLINNIDNYNLLIENIIKKISNNIFNYKLLSFNFIKTTVPKFVFSNIEDVKNYSDFTNYSDKLYEIEPSFIRIKIALLINLNYKFKNKKIVENYNSYFSLTKNNQNWLILWANQEISTLIEILNSNITFLYEKEYLWIYWRIWTVEELFLKKVWNDYLKSTEWKKIIKNIEKNNTNITKVKSINIFCWKHIESTSGSCYMSDECKSCTKFN